MGNIPISVIVAVYNAEKTVSRLIESLKAQTMQDFEVLLIDDGSTDASGSICDSITQADNRFKVFHKPNQGIGATRQFGIEHATGVYTIHTDSDDWVEPDYLQLLYNKALDSNADMVICDVLEEKKKKTVFNSQEPLSYDKEGLLEDLIDRLLGGPWNKLIKRSFYINHGIKYLDGLSYGEDKIFNLELVKAGASVSYVHAALYHLDECANPDSAVRGISQKHLLAREKYIEKLRELFPEEKYRTCLDRINLGTVYLAVSLKFPAKKLFYQNYGFLKRLKWKDYGSWPFLTKLVIWTSLHCSYSLAVVLSRIKKIMRQLNK